MKGVITVLGALVLIIVLAGATAGSAEQTMLDQQLLGTVESVGLASHTPGSKMLLSEVRTTDGRTYFAYGVMQGLEKTELSMETAQNGVKYLCGGAPKNCSQLVE